MPASATKIRPEQPADHDSIRAIVSSAFGSDAEADLVEAIRASEQYRPELALVSMWDGAVVGHVMVSEATLVTERGDRPIPLLSPLAVRPDVQGRGVGGALVRAVTAAARRVGEVAVVLEGSPAYYGRLGFVASSTLGIELPLPSWAPGEAAQIIVFDDEDRPPPGRVVFPSAFDGLE